MALRYMARSTVFIEQNIRSPFVSCFQFLNEHFVTLLLVNRFSCSLSLILSLPLCMLPSSENVSTEAEEYSLLGAVLQQRLLKTYSACSSDLYRACISVSDIAIVTSHYGLYVKVKR
jgi:hypothetical protein